MLNVLYRTCRDINDISTKKLNYFILLGFVHALNMLAWCGLLIPNDRNINNLEQVQRRATRFILGRDYSEYMSALVS